MVPNAAPGDLGLSARVVDVATAVSSALLIPEVGHQQVSPGAAADQHDGHSVISASTQTAGPVIATASCSDNQVSSVITFSGIEHPT
jgi:hypothetical protein